MLLQWFRFHRIFLKITQFKTALSKFLWKIEDTNDFDDFWWIFPQQDEFCIFSCRKSRSPGKRTSRSPSRSPGRSPFGSDENDRVNNNETASGPSASSAGNSTFLQQQKSIREREEEKRRLQAEMRRREQELLAKIKEQQRELESMKHEKGKVMIAENGCLFKNPVKNVGMFCQIGCRLLIDLFCSFFVSHKHTFF